MTAPTVTLPAFGTLIPSQGGVFAAILRAPQIDGIEQPPFALIVSNAADGEFKSIWGAYGKDVAGAASRIDGKANTEAMVQAECEAALKVRALAVGGHADWYLPSLGELNSAAANVPEIFEKSGWYWTSTQDSSGYAFVQDFEYGDSYWDGKGYGRRVRACRRIQLDALNA